MAFKRIVIRPAVNAYATHEQPRRAEKPTESTKKVAKEGWEKRPGKGDHINYKKVGVREVITPDTGSTGNPDGHSAAHLQDRRMALVMERTDGRTFSLLLSWSASRKRPYRQFPQTGVSNEASPT